jgi:dolichyl-phosphate-mannose-protein mannosyltransferase
MDLLQPDLRPVLSAGRPAADAVSTRIRPDRVLWIVLAVLTACRLGYLALGTLDLSPDESHYWEWSRRLDLSYYSKGPLVAYLIRGLTSVLGTSAFAIRAGAVLLSLLGSLAIYRLAREAFGDPRVGLLAVIGLQLTPLFWAGSLLLTIDGPFITLWVLALLGLYRATIGGARDGWLVAGVAVGLGLLAKFTMLFILPGLALYLWRAPEARRWLARPAPYGAAALAALLLGPVVIWNAQRGWVSARHVASQGTGGGWSLAQPPEFVGAQILVLTPLVAGILGWALWFGIREGLVRGREPYRFLTAFAVPVLGFYALLSLQGKIQANWPAAAYPSLGLVAAGALVERARRLDPAGRRRQRAWIVAAGGMALGISLLGHATDRIGLPPELDPTTRLRGWEELGARVSAVRRQMPAPDRTFLVSDRYQIASELAFYAEGRPATYNVNLGRRLNQYDFWEGPDSRRGWDAIFVQEGTGGLDHRVAEAFERTEGPILVEVRRGDRAVRRFTLYRGFGFRGMKPPGGPTTY